jgi:hypothetical protein
VDGPDHTMAMVGYDDRIWVDINRDGLVQANEKGAFKIADSFGTNEALHNQGFLWLAQDTLDGSIYLDRFHRMSVRSNYQPRKVARMTLRHAKRDALKFQFGRSATNDKAGIDPSLVFDPYGLGFGVGEAGVSLIAGGAVPFDGGTTAMDGSFAFDLTDIDGGSLGGYWYLRIANAGDSPLTIQSFEVRGLEHGNTAKDTDLPITVTGGEFFRFVPRASP